MRITAPLKGFKYSHPTYAMNAPLWRTIDDLREGLPTLALKVRDYLPKRPNETEEEYVLRTRKLSYTPIMSTAIREFAVKLASAPLSLSNLEIDDFWQAWAANTDGQQSDITALVQGIFIELLFYGEVFIGVDRAGNARTVAESQRPELRPYCVVYRPTSVPQYGDDWYITVQDSDLSEPLSEPFKRRRWTVWKADSIDTYEADIRLDSLGYLSGIRTPGTEQWQAATDAFVLSGERTPHSIGQAPMAHLKLPIELHTARQAYPKQIQHFVLDNAWYDTGAIAGSVQRIFTPADPKPMHDPRTAYEDAPEQVKVGNPYVLIGKGFQFVESTGAAIGALTSQLETIERQVKTLASMGYSVVSNGALEQSGKSKSIDRDMLSATMQSYGKMCGALLEEILAYVAAYASKTERPQVSGLDAYDVDSTSVALEQSGALLALGDYVPFEAKKLWFKKLTSSLLGHIGPVDSAMINEAYERMVPPTPTDTE